MRRAQDLLEGNKGLIIKLAWQWWRRLPTRVKQWVEPEDLMQEAYRAVLENANKKYDGRAGQTTFIYVGISNLFLNFAISQQTKKRFGWNVPLEDVVLWVRDRQTERVESVDALLTCYAQASEECRQEMRGWFGQERPKVRRSELGKRIYREFRILADANGLTANDCRQLMRGGLWLG